MDIQDIRRARFAQLIKKYGSQAKFVEETEENQGEVSALLRDKPFGEKKARKLEIKCGLTRGWLDTPIDYEPLNVAQERAEYGAKQMLTYVTYEEMMLLTQLREATETGRKMILDTASSVEKSPTALKAVTSNNQA